MDVDLIHQGFLRGFKDNNGQMILNSEVTKINKTNDLWEITTNKAVYSAKNIVNAAGAWGDEIGKLAKCNPIGLKPKRRTIIIFEPQKKVKMLNWPVVIDIEDKDTIITIEKATNEKNYQEKDLFNLYKRFTFNIFC